MPVRVSTGLGGNGTFGYLPEGYPALRGAGGVLCGASAELPKTFLSPAGPALGCGGLEFGRTPEMMDTANHEPPGLSTEMGERQQNQTPNSNHGGNMAAAGAAEPGGTPATGAPPFPTSCVPNCP